MVKVSVIVAVYNAEKYLDRCVRSLQTQTMRDIEVLLVDDGSSDRSGEMCDGYAAQDSRIRVLHNSHQGVGPTRQTGLDNVQGKYVIQVDSDDWIDENMIEKLYEVAEAKNTEITVCDVVVEESMGSRVWSGINSEISGKSLLLDMYADRVYGGPGNKLIKVDWLKRIGVHYPLNVTWGENYCVWGQLFIYPLKMEYISGVYYHYDRFSNNASLDRLTPDTKLSSMQIVIGMLSDLLGRDGYQECLYQLKVRAKDQAFLTQGMTTRRYRNLYKEINLRYLKDKLSSTKVRDKVCALALVSFYKPVSSVYFAMLNARYRMKHNKEKHSDSEI